MAVLFYILFCFMVTNLVQSLKWTHHVILDRESMFHLFWTPLNETIRFELQVNYSADSNKCAVWNINNRAGYYIGLVGHYIKNHVLFNNFFLKKIQK